MGSIYYDIAATGIIILNLFLYFHRRHLFTSQSRIFLVLLFVSLGAAVMDIIGVVSYWQADRIPLPVLYGINVVYYLFQHSLPFVYLLFILSLSGRLFRMSWRDRLALTLPYIGSLALILSNPATVFVFGFDEHLEYFRGPGLNILYGIAAFYLITSIVYLHRDKRHIPKDTSLAVFLFLPVSLLPIVIQYLNPHLLIQNLGIALSGLIIILTIQDFGNLVDRTGGLFNSDGLAAQLELLGIKGRRMSLFLINLDTPDFLRHVLGPTTFSSLEQILSEKLFGHPKHDRFAALLGPGRFVLVLVDPLPERLSGEREQLNIVFRQPWLIEGHLLNIAVRMCEIRYPEDSSDFQLVFHAQQGLSGVFWKHPRNILLSVKDLSLSSSGRSLEVSRCIRSALEKSRFEVYFQPVIRAADGRTVSAEALLRLHDEKLGWVPPDEFIPVAEQNGSIHALGDYVMEKACAFLSLLRKSGYHLDTLNINLSALQCIQANLTERMMATSRKYGLKPENLCFEVTETAAHSSPGAMQRNMEELSAAGFLIAIDDYGTGYSNLYNLLSIPFHSIKLDRSIINAMDETKQSKVFMEGTIAMFKHGDIELVAEGVEREDQLRELNSLGVDLIQGYYYSKPVPPDQFLRFLRERGSLCI